MNTEKTQSRLLWILLLRNDPNIKPGPLSSTVIEAPAHSGAHGRFLDAGVLDHVEQQLAHSLEQ